MTMTDPIADMITRIRNASSVQHTDVEMPVSSVKIEIARILKQEGYIESYEIAKGESFDTLVIGLKYGPNKEKVISGLKRISKPGLRVYAKKDELPRVLGGYGIAIVSTSKGIVTEREAGRIGVGGEVLCYVW